MDEFLFAIGEDGVLREYEEPFATVEFKTEEDYNRFVEMVAFWKENHNEGETNG